jgi:hypothetical protein
MKASYNRTPLSSNCTDLVFQDNLSFLASLHVTDFSHVRGLTGIVGHRTFIMSMNCL